MLAKIMTAKIKGSPAAALSSPSPQIRQAAVILLAAVLVFLATVPVAITLITPYVTRVAIHISAVAVYVAMRFFYRLETPPAMYFVGYFYVLSFHLYALRSFHLTKIGKPLLEGVYCLVASAVNFVLCTFLIPKLGIVGALCATSIAQLIIVILYHRGSIFVRAVD